MKRHILLVCTLVACLVAACGPNREKDVMQIEQMESQLRQANYIADSATCSSLLSLYLRFAHNYPNDTLTPRYLYNASDFALNIGKYDTSILCLKQIIDDYPDFSEAATCYFLIGNAYEQSENYDSAVAAYNEFIRLYPDHPLKESAMFAVKNIGLPLDEVLARMLANAATEE